MKLRVCSEALVMPSRTGCLGVLLVHLGLVEVVALEQAGVARLEDFQLLQHLAHDRLDVLVVDRHALQSVDLLDLIDQEVSERLDALDPQDIVRVRVAVDDVLALADDVAIVDRDVLALRDQELDRLATVFRGDLDAALVLVVPTELDPAVHFRDDRAVLRTTGFEELGDPRQTAGDVPRLGAFRGDPRHDFAGLHLVAVADRQNGADR